MKTREEFVDRLQELKAPEGFNWDLISKKHAPIIVKWRNDPAILSFMERDNKLKLEDQIEFLENYESYDRVDLILSCNSEPVGVFNIKNFEMLPEYGAIIGESFYRSKGLGTKVKLLIFEYWFCSLNKKEIFVRNKKSNQKVIDSNKRWGFDNYKEDGNFILLRLKRGVFLSESRKNFSL